MSVELLERTQSIPFVSTVTHYSPGLTVQFSHVYKNYGSREVLRNLELTVEAGEFVAIIGRSGCGKSTALRLTAGLEPSSSGRILYDGALANGLPPDVRVMFQDARLLPWRSVIENIGIGLSRDSRSRAYEVLAAVGLPDRAKDWPLYLSGGQQQRVALARALVHQPRLLLLDEPLGALDALTRIEMQTLIESLWETNGFTALLVTHDVAEAITLADRVILIEDGAITLNETIALPRPRVRGSADFAALEASILNRILQR